MKNEIFFRYILLDGCWTSHIQITPNERTEPVQAQQNRLELHLTWAGPVRDRTVDMAS